MCEFLHLLCLWLDGAHLRNNRGEVLRNSLTLWTVFIVEKEKSKLCAVVDEVDVKKSI